MSFEEYRKEVVKIISELASIDDSEEEEKVRKLIRKARTIERENNFFKEIKQSVQNE